MFSKEQEQLLDKFADLSDKLFDLGIITTDSFTGEIGEYFACKLFDLTKADRVTRAYDGVSQTGKKYQVKSKIISNSFNYTIKGLESNLFDYLVVVYFDRLYNPKKIIRVPSRGIKENEIRISTANINSFESFDTTGIKLSPTNKKVLGDFANVYHELEKKEIIRSKRIVGDIGEFYACRRLNLIQSENKNEKGIDARHPNGLTFEIKTRRVYTSGRRTGEARRLNNLVGKSADYLVVVTLDRSFKCSGMWLIPMKNVKNPKSAHLGIVNDTIGTVNLVPSTISWLKTGDSFKGFKGTSTDKGKIETKSKGTTKSNQTAYKLKEKRLSDKLPSTTIIPSENEHIDPFIGGSTWKLFIASTILVIILYIIGKLTNHFSYDYP